MTTIEKLRVGSHTIHTASGTERSLELNHEPNDEYVDVHILDNGYAVIGYLVRDEDCSENPINDTDGMGRIYDRRRNASNESKRNFYEAVGYDEYGDASGKPDPYAVLLDVYEHSGEVWRVTGSGDFFCDERWDVSTTAGVWVPDDCCCEHIEVEACKRLVPGLEVENRSKYNEDGSVKMLPGTDKPDPKYFNVITWTLPDGRSRGGYKTFSNAIMAGIRAAGVKIDKKELKNKAREVAVECAQQAVKTYNSWISGDVYGVCVDVFDANDELVDEDACWNYIGDDYAKECLAEEVKRQIEKYSKKENAP